MSTFKQICGLSVKLLNDTLHKNPSMLTELFNNLFLLRRTQSVPCCFCYLLTTQVKADKPKDKDRLNSTTLELPEFSRNQTT